MSVIQRIRDKGAWIISSLIALALIAFILQDRGASRGSLFSDNNTIGKVNGQKIDAQDFRERVNMMVKQGAMRGMTVETAVQQMWNEETVKSILLNECDKLGLICSQKESSEALFSPNSQFMQQYFRDPKTGEFDYERARMAVNQIKKSKNTADKKSLYEGYVEPIELQTLQQKYQALIDHSVYVPKWMVEKQQADNNAISSVSYVYVPYNTVVDTTIKVSDEEIMAYAQKHKKEYEREDETRSLSYITFDASASPRDSTDVRDQLNKLKNEFAASADAKSFISKTGSELSYYDGYISKKEIKVPVKDSLFKLPVGAIYGPYLDQNNYVVAKIVGEKTIPDTVKVRHILIATVQRDQSGAMQKVREDSTAKRIVDSVQLAIKNGTSFDSLVVKYSDDGGSKDKGGVYDNIAANAGMVPEFNDFIFTGKKTGDKGIIKTEFGYHYIEILSQKGSDNGYKIAYLAKPIIISDKTISDATSAAGQFWSTTKSYKDFTANAAKLNKTALPANDIKENDFTVQGLGTARKLVYWTYNHDAGDITSELIKVGDKYVVAIVTAVNKPGLPTAATLRPMVEFFVRNEKKAKIIANKFKGNSLETYASGAGVTVQKADSLSFAVPFVPGIGNGENKFIGAAFNASMKGKATDPIAGLQGVYAIRVENISAKVGDNNVDMIKQRLLQMQGSNTRSFMEALKKDANIKDYRGKFYTE